VLAQTRDTVLNGTVHQKGDLTKKEGAGVEEGEAKGAGVPRPSWVGERLSHLLKTQGQELS